MKQKILPHFYVLEGLDGSGTSTQMDLLARKFHDSGYSCHTTCEPTSGPIGLFIRRVLRKEETVTPETLAYLFAADRNEHLFRPQEGIVDRVARKEVVLSDRYFFSSLAYQGHYCGFDFVRSLNERFPLPEHLIFLDVSPENCQNRLSGRSNREIFDDIKEQYGILKLYENAIEVYAESGMKIHRINGEKTPSEVMDRIWSFIAPVPIK